VADGDQKEAALGQEKGAQEGFTRTKSSPATRLEVQLGQRASFCSESTATGLRGLRGKRRLRCRFRARVLDSFCEEVDSRVAELQGNTEEHGAAWYDEARRRPVPGSRAGVGERSRERGSRERRGERG
jgi:hypothetical protein